MEHDEHQLNARPGKARPVDLNLVRNQSQSADKNVRRQAIATVREQAQRQLHQHYFDIAAAMIKDPDNKIRWQSMIVVGEFVETTPEQVWQVVQRHADSPDSDMQSAVATILLEHLLEHHFDEYFPKVVKYARTAGDNFCQTLNFCWDVGGRNAHQWHKVERLIVKMRKGHG